MIDKTQSEHNESGYPPIANIRANIAFRRSGPRTAASNCNKSSLQRHRLAVLFSLRQLLCDLAGVLDKKLRDGVERAVFQGDDSNWHAGHGQFNGQDLQLRTPGGKFQCGGRGNRKKPPGRQETNPHVGGIGNHSRARIVEPAGTKGFYCDRPRHGVRLWQRPRFVLVR